MKYITGTIGNRTVIFGRDQIERYEYVDGDINTLDVYIKGRREPVHIPGAKSIIEAGRPKQYVHYSQFNEGGYNIFYEEVSAWTPEEGDAIILHMKGGSTIKLEKLLADKFKTNWGYFLDYVFE